MLFPNVLRVSNCLQFRVPVDDTHTLHVRFEFAHLAEGETAHDRPVPFTPGVLYDEADGKFKRDYVVGQDITAWVIWGLICDRRTKHLGVSDVGLFMYRRMLDQQARVVEDGGEPINVWRDPVASELIVLPVEETRYPGYEGTGGPFRELTPREPDVEAALSGEGVTREESRG